MVTIYNAVEPASDPIPYAPQRYLGWRPAGEWHPVVVTGPNGSAGVLACRLNGTWVETGDFAQWPEYRGIDMPIDSGRAVLDPPYPNTGEPARVYSCTSAGGVVVSDVMPSSIPVGHLFNDRASWAAAEGPHFTVLSQGGGFARAHQFSLSGGTPAQVGYTDLTIVIPFQTDSTDGGVTNPRGSVLLWPQRNLGDGQFQTYECDLAEVPLTFRAKANMTVVDPLYGINSIRTWRTNGDRTSQFRVNPLSLSGRENTGTGQGFIRVAQADGPGVEAWAYDGSDYVPSPVVAGSSAPQLGLAPGVAEFVVGGQSRQFLGAAYGGTDYTLQEFWFPLTNPEWSALFDTDGTNGVGINFAPGAFFEVAPGYYVTTHANGDGTTTLYRFTGVAPATRRYLRPQRHSQRGDGFNMSSAPRHIQGRTRQSTNRNFGIR